MKYSVQYTNLCLGKFDLVIIFLFFHYQDSIVYLLRTRNILIVPSKFPYPKIDDSFDIDEKA